MKVVIIEDEKLSAEQLTLFLHRIDVTIEIIKYLETVKESIIFFQQEHDIDLIFLDIHLADGNSFEIFKHTTITTPIIFTTAFDKYAIDAFKQNSIDYLLKPIAIQDLQFAITKLKQQQQISTKKLLENISVAYQQTSKTYKNRFLVKQGQTIDSIETKDIHHFETQESITFLVLATGKRFPIDNTLDQLETILSPTDFFRVNRKIIIHFNSIQKTNTYTNGRLQIQSLFLTQDACIVSRERVHDFKMWLDQ